MGVLTETLGGRLTEQIVFNDGSRRGVGNLHNKSYDVAIAEDAYGAKGRLHHFTYAVDNREAILRGGYLFGARRLHRNRSAQTCHPADVLFVCV